MVYIGSARKDERGKYSGGAKGDQLQKSTPDYKGEVSQQPFYVHSKGCIKDEKKIFKASGKLLKILKKG